MPSSPGSVLEETVRLDHGRAVVCFHGRLDVHTAAQARRVLAEVVLAHSVWRFAHLLVDLSEVDELDVAGINAIVGPLMAARRSAVRCNVVRPVAPAAARVMDQTAVLAMVTAP